MRMRLILAEIILLLASVFVFRSAWLLIDTQAIMREISALWISLIIGLVVVAICFHYIIRQRKKQI